MRRTDRQFAKLGFELDHENKYGAIYRKDLGKYYHTILIFHKLSAKGKVTYEIESFRDDINANGMNDSLPMTKKEAKLALKKLKEIKRRYAKQWR